MMEKYQILKELVSFNTIKDKNNKNIVEYIENILKEKCFEKISKVEAIKILRDIGITEDKLQMTYEEIIQV